MYNLTSAHTYSVLLSWKHVSISHAARLYTELCIAPYILHMGIHNNTDRITIVYIILYACAHSVLLWEFRQAVWYFTNIPVPPTASDCIYSLTFITCVLVVGWKVFCVISQDVSYSCVGSEQNVLELPRALLQEEGAPSHCNVLPATHSCHWSLILHSHQLHSRMSVQCRQTQRLTSTTMLSIQTLGAVLQWCTSITTQHLMTACILSLHTPLTQLL